MLLPGCGRAARGSAPHAVLMFTLGWVSMTCRGSAGPPLLLCGQRKASVSETLGFGLQDRQWVQIRPLYLNLVVVSIICQSSFNPSVYFENKAFDSIIIGFK